MKSIVTMEQIWMEQTTLLRTRTSATILTENNFANIRVYNTMSIDQ